MRVYVDGSGGPGGVSVYVDGVSSGGGPTPPPAPPTARDYIQDGLVVIFDGIDNYDWGVHSSDVNTWTELVSGTKYSCASGSSFDSNSLLWSSGSVFSLQVPAISGETFFTSSKTLEFVGSVDSTTANSLGLRKLQSATQSGARFGTAQRSHGNPIDYYYTDVDLYAKYNGRELARTYPAQDNSYPPTMLAVSLVEASGAVQPYSKGEPVGAAISATIPSYGDGWGVLRWVASPGCHAYRISVYNRALTAEEVAFNHALDIRRFGLEA